MIRTHLRFPSLRLLLFSSSSSAFCCDKVSLEPDRATIHRNIGQVLSQIEPTEWFRTEVPLSFFGLLSLYLSFGDTICALKLHAGVLFYMRFRLIHPAAQLRRHKCKLLQCLPNHQL